MAMAVPYAVMLLAADGRGEEAKPDDDELKLSLAPAGKPYPTEFDSKSGDEWSYFVLKRVKSD